MRAFYLPFLVSTSAIIKPQHFGGMVESGHWGLKLTLK